MNRNFFGFLGLLIALLLAISVYFLMKKSSKSTLDLKEIDFAVKDTASIQKVMLTGYIDGNNVGRVYLTKKNHQWWVNDEFKAQNIAVENLLNTIFSIQMQQPLHPNAIENVKKLIKKRNVHVVITHQNGKIIKGYYIGPATPDSKGNYVILEGAENPYIAEIPGFSGYLSTRFSANPEVWRDYTLWNLEPNQFFLFELKDKTQNKLIQIQRKNDVYLVNNQIFSDTNSFRNLLKNYLLCVGTGVAKTSFPNSQDSLSKIPADFTLKINDKQFLLWTNPLGSFFIVPVKKENNSMVFDGEIMLLQKLTVQRWLLDKK